MSLHSTLTKKGQTTLPRAVRDALGVASGERVVYEIEGDTVRMRSARALLDTLCGRFARPELGPQDLGQAREDFAADAAKLAQDDS